MSASAQSVALLRTKLEVPASTGALLSRPRLHDYLPRIAATRLTLLQAPAGYGKTTLMAQWSRTLATPQRIVSWLSCDASDRDPAMLLTYLAASLADAGLAIEPKIEHFLRSQAFATADSLIAAISNSLSRCNREVHLFLDDVHQLDAASFTALGRVLERAPANTRFVLATRGTPELPLARLRMQDQILELDTADLRFNDDETRRFIEQAGLALAADELAGVQQRLEGWITGFKVVSLAQRNNPGSRRRLSRLSDPGRSVADFFEQEVLAALPPERVDFLQRSAVLNRLSASVCEAVTGIPDARRHLQSIEQAGLFAVRLDEDGVWFRYHQLFQDFLRQSLERRHPGAGAALHARASEWFWNAGSPIEAIEHALEAGDAECAAELLELSCHDLTYTGRFSLVRKFTAQIPEALLSRKPRVLLTMAWLLTRSLQYDEVRRLLAQAHAHVETLATAVTTDNAELRQLRYLIAHREMMLAAAEDRPADVEQRCEALLRDFAEEQHPYLSCTIYAQLLFARREQYQLADFERLQALAQGAIERSGFSFATIALQASIGPSLHFAGRSDAARRALEKGLDQAVRYGGANSSLAALPALPLSELIYETNDLDRAERLIDDTLPYASEFGFVDTLMPGFITQARVRRARGDHQGSYRALETAARIATQRGLQRLSDAVLAETVKLLLQDGDLLAAQVMLDAHGLPLNGELLQPRPEKVSTGLEFRAIAWTRVAHAQNRVADALSLAKAWRNFCSARGAIRSLITWDLLQANMLVQSDDLRAAQRLLREAISHATAGRLIRCFIDEGAAIAQLITATYDANLEVLHPTDAFAVDLLDALLPSRRHVVDIDSGIDDAELRERFTAKECEILSLIGRGMRNREVARTLGMTEGSVKWYMQQVYDKLGTRRRLQAVERARRCGAIA